MTKSQGGMVEDCAGYIGGVVTQTINTQITT
jgi:hypothetical protein